MKIFLNLSGAGAGTDMNIRVLIVVFDLRNQGLRELDVEYCLLDDDVCFVAKSCIR